MAKKILIVDDDPIVLKYLGNLLTDNGYKTYKAATGIEGTKLMEKIKPNLITLDLQMPEEWGPRFYRRMTKNRDLKDIPIIVISGLSSSKYSIPKAVAHLGKPFDAEELLRLIRENI